MGFGNFRHKPCDDVLHDSGNKNFGHGANRDLMKYPLSRYSLADLSGIVGHVNAEDDNAFSAGTFGATPDTTRR